MVKVVQNSQNLGSITQHSLSAALLLDILSKGGGGISICVKDCYTTVEIPTDSDIEACWAQVQLQGNSNLYLNAVYRPEGDARTQVAQFGTDLAKITAKTTPRDHVMIGGDFNFKDIDWSSCTVQDGAANKAASDDFLETLADHSKQQMNENSTREGAVLNLFITNKPNLVRNMDTTPSISDHESAIIADCYLKPVITTKPPRWVFVWAQANWQKMKADIHLFASTFSMRDKTVDNGWNDIKEALNSTIDRHIPTKTVKSRPKHRQWISASIRRRSRKQQRLYKKAKRSNSEDHWRQFKDFRKESVKLNNRARTKYINEKVIGELTPDNTKPFWRFVKSLRVDSISIPPLREGAALITDAVQRASLLGKEFRSAFTHEDTSHIPSFGPRTSSTITPIHVEVAGVQKLLNRLKPNKACWPDKIPNRVLKELAPVLAPPLTALYNKSLEEGTVPAEWRHALVTPVYKKGDKHSPSNYRPVSLTVVCCKLLEHIVCNHVLTHLEENNLLTTLQHGFRRGHSCETQLLLTYDDLIRSFDKTLQTDMAILDFSRAFDTVPHRRLISKLTSYGVKGQVLTWIDSFLSDRKMTVVVDGHTAKESIRVLSGVPQGTVLGPLLFLVYINDIVDAVSTGTTIRLFADDCLVYRPLRKNNEDEDQRVLQHDLDALEAWTDKWGMRFNPSKCQIMQVKRGNSPPKLHLYELMDTVLQNVTKAKYLGVWLSINLDWDHQIGTATNKANTSLHFISRNLSGCSRSAREHAVRSLTMSHLQYCCTVWDPHKKKSKDQLEMVKRRAARCVFNNRWRDRAVSPTAILRQLSWREQEQKRRHQRLVMTYKIVHGEVAIPRDRFAAPGRLTRHDHNRTLGTKHSSHDTVKNSFFWRVHDWNSLHQDTVDATSVEAFRNRLNKP